MNKEELNRLLDNIYELEGLVHLALNRDDNPASLPELIARKGEELCRLAKMTAGVEDADKPQAEEIEVADEAVEPMAQAEDVVETLTRIGDSVEPVAQTEDAAEPAVLEEDAPETVAQVEEVRSYAKAPGAEPRGRLVFSINDRYRFKKELFGGSDAEFNTTLALVASMESYDEAEDYFLGELQWDQRKPEVNDFLEIIKRYFN